MNRDDDYRLSLNEIFFKMTKNKRQTKPAATARRKPKNNATTSAIKGKPTPATKGGKRKKDQIEDLEETSLFDSSFESDSYTSDNDGSKDDNDDLGEDDDLGDDANNEEDDDEEDDDKNRVGADDDDEEDRAEEELALEKAVVDVVNIEDERHSRILKVMPRTNFDDHRFFGPSPAESKEIIYLLSSFSLDAKSVDDEIRSAAWKNLRVLMPLDFVFFNQKSMIEELYAPKNISFKNIVSKILRH